MISQTLRLSVFIWAGLICGTASAQDASEADRLMSLSRTEFLEEYEKSYIGNLILTDQLIQRMDPALVDLVDHETAISEAERASFACSYDYMANAEALPALVAQMQQIAPVKARAAEDENFSYAEFVNDPELLESLQPIESDAFYEMMDACDTASFARARLNFTPEFWERLGAISAERGLIDQ